MEIELPRRRQAAWWWLRYIVEIIWFLCRQVASEYMRGRELKKCPIHIFGGRERGREARDGVGIGLCLNTDAPESRCWKIHLYNLGGKKDRAAERMGGKRWGAGRLSNYPFKPNLRCCLKLTYANEEAESHWGLRWLRLYRSKIGFHILSQYYQMQILHRAKTLCAI